MKRAPPYSGRQSRERYVTNAIRRFLLESSWSSKKSPAWNACTPKLSPGPRSIPLTASRKSLNGGSVTTRGTARTVRGELASIADLETLVKAAKAGARGHIIVCSRLEDDDIAGELNDNVMAELCALVRLEA